MKWNKWSLERIRQGRKFITSRTKKTLPADDPEVIAVLIHPLPLWFIKQYLYLPEGASDPEELQRKINQIFRRKVDPYRELYVHVIDTEKVMEANPL